MASSDTIIAILKFGVIPSYWYTVSLFAAVVVVHMSKAVFTPGNMLPATCIPLYTATDGQQTEWTVIAPADEAYTTH